MFPNIRAELGRRKMTKRDLSAETGIKYGTLISKLNGESEFTFTEAVGIKKALKTEMPLEDLFEPDELEDEE